MIGLEDIFQCQEVSAIIWDWGGFPPNYHMAVGIENRWYWPKGNCGMWGVEKGNNQI